MQSVEQTDFFDLRCGGFLCDLLTFDWLLLALTPAVAAAAAAEDWSHGLQGIKHLRRLHSRDASNGMFQKTLSS